MNLLINLVLNGLMASTVDPVCHCVFMSPSSVGIRSLPPRPYYVPPHVGVTFGKELPKLLRGEYHQG